MPWLIFEYGAAAIALGMVGTLGAALLVKALNGFCLHDFDGDEAVIVKGERTDTRYLGGGKYSEPHVIGYYESRRCHKCHVVKTFDY
jgi:hypothetical protein